ncbi:MULTISPECIES: YiiX/YebB-like N1pC/P60 family cysteine hydrolase [Bacillaceae]|uniref:YiiX/YebB-like N1pC/P60 family cysteine hydrolase n=2 Tax=Bacillales TaxID=1385 RepID=UPI00082477F4|nr:MULTISPECIES: YiiX/YebB-like N1pC/P60 family cysteine hydrolase [Bacillaceae]MCT1542104.1 hypothetical protein [Lysinibacillus capsici]MCT1650341.1 hypothetical protein [Lysinibacillus capsici]MCT1728732.1 hypothetical protein [Lysinibacillus capsici]MCT1786554.1 hypothetical protein [Lysinibacillus capsici]MCT2347422.1 hypothetical protein [Niallia taxi]
MNTKKIFTCLFFSLFGLLLMFSYKPLEAHAYNYPNKTAAKAGDILVTKETNCKTDCKGLSGHAAIVVDSTYYVHISGPGAHPTKEKLSTWFDSRYGKSTKVVRPTSQYKGSPADAAKWAKNYVKEYKDAVYDITSGNHTFDRTYCSKLVWQAYNFGTAYPIIAPKHVGGLIHPYDFTTAASGGRYADLETVYTNW